MVSIIRQFFAILQLTTVAIANHMKCRLWCENEYFVLTFSICCQRLLCQLCSNLWRCSLLNSVADCFKHKEHLHIAVETFKGLQVEIFDAKRCEFCVCSRTLWTPGGTAYPLSLGKQASIRSFCALNFVSSVIRCHWCFSRFICTSNPQH